MARITWSRLATATLMALLDLKYDDSQEGGDNSILECLFFGILLEYCSGMCWSLSLCCGSQGEMLNSVKELVGGGSQAEFPDSY